MRSPLRLFTHNWKLKLAAFALAMLLWITVSADQITARWLPVPVDVQVPLPGYELLDGPAPSEVEVRFSGPFRELWELAITRPPVQVVVREPTDGEQQLLLEPQQVQIPRGRTVTALDIRPAVIRVALRQVAQAEVAVRLMLAEQIPEGLALVGGLTIDPGRIRVSGAAARVEQVAELQTRPLELSRQEGAFERRIEIDTAGLADLQLSTDEVVVSGRLERAVEGRLTGLPVRAPAGAMAAPSSVDVQLRGAESVVRGLSAANLRVVVPADQVPERLTASGADVALRVEQLPAGVVAELSPPTVRLLPLPPAPPTPEVRVQPAPPPEALTDTVAVGDAPDSP